MDKAPHPDLERTPILCRNGPTGQYLPSDVEIRLRKCEGPEKSVQELLTGHRSKQSGGGPINYEAKMMREVLARLTAGATNLANVGKVGIGKTVAGMWGASHLGDFFYITALDLARCGASEEDRKLLDRARDFPILMLDELGDEPAHHFPKIGNILRSRMSDGLVTIICTNRLATDLVGAPARGNQRQVEPIYGTPVARRIEEQIIPHWLVSSQEVLCPGEQLRQQRLNGR